MIKKVITFEGGSGFGKSTMAQEFNKNSDFLVHQSISKDVYRRINLLLNYKKGSTIEELENRSDEEDPIRLFSDIFYDIRLKEYQDSQKIENDRHLLFDRFLFFPIVSRIFAKTKVPNHYYSTLQKECRVDKIFIFEPIEPKYYKDGWPRESISFTESVTINKITFDVAKGLGYEPILVPFDSVENRYDFILKHID